MFFIGHCRALIHLALTIFKLASLHYTHTHALTHTHTHTHILVKCMAIVIDWRTLDSHFFMMDSEVEVVLLIVKAAAQVEQKVSGEFCCVASPLENGQGQADAGTSHTHKHTHIYLNTHTIILCILLLLHILVLASLS